SNRLPVFLLFRRIHSVRGGVHGKTVHHLLYRKVFQLSIVFRILLLKNRDEATRTCSIDSTEAWIEFHDIRACRDWQMSDCFVGVQCKNNECFRSVAQKKCAMVL